MVFQPLTILYAVIVFSFIVTSVFMFKPKGDERVHIIFLWLGVALAFLVTFINATSLPAENIGPVLIAWCGIIPAALGIIIRMITGKTNSIANILIMLSTVYGAVSYFIMS